MRKLLMLAVALLAVMLATLLAQEEEKEEPAGREQAMIGNNWFVVKYPSDELKLKAWLFVPPGASETPAAAVLRIPAGGNLFTPSVLGLGTVPEIEPYVTSGYVTMVMSFRGTLDNEGNFNRSQSGLDDVLAALEFLRKQPEVDPKNIFVAGHSSAATLALRAAQVSDIPRAVAAFSPVTEWSEFFKTRLEGVSDETRKFLIDSSPLTHAAKAKCPVMITHGTGDKIVPFSQSERMAKKMQEAGKPCEFVSIPFADHYRSMLKVGVPLSICWFSEIQKYGKTTELYRKLRDNMLEDLKRPGGARQH